MASFFFSKKILPTAVQLRSFQEDFLFLKDYETRKEGGQDWLFKIDKYKEDNIAYGNIFAYFEIPTNSQWSLVPFKTPSRIYLKAPIFLITGSDLFSFLWWLSGLIVGIWLFFAFIWRSSDHIIILLFLSLVFFTPINVFDWEFIFLFALIIMLYFYNLRKNNFYLLFYFIFWLYISFSRLEYFYFFSVFNLALSLSWIYQKKYIKLISVLLVSWLFILAFFIVNEKYYGWYLKSWYEIYYGNYKSQSGSDAGGSLLELLFTKPLSIIFPSWFNLSSTVDISLYILKSTIGIGCFIFLFWRVRYWTDFIFWKSKYLSYWILVFIIYAIFFYASDPHSYRPINDPTHSSYTRYLWVFILLIWTLFYHWLRIIPGKISMIIYSTFIIVFFFLWPQYFGAQNNALNPEKYLASMATKIPPQSVIFTFNPSSFMFSDYRVIHPSGEDQLEYKSFVRYGTPRGRDPANNSRFLDNIWYFIYKTKTPVYFLNERYWGADREVIFDFFRNKNSLVFEKNKNGIDILKPNNYYVGEYVYNWAEED